jgi:hypothetical protein
MASKAPMNDLSVKGKAEEQRVEKKLTPSPPTPSSLKQMPVGLDRIILRLNKYDFAA